MPQSQEKQVKQQKRKIPVKLTLLSKKYMTPVGNKIMPIYELQYNEKARKDLVVKIGEQDIDDFIQKSQSSTDMAFLQREAIRTGQYPVDPTAQYGVDQTLFPSNIHELYRTTKDINTHFNSLGEHAQKCFGTAEAYKEAVLDGTAESKLNAYFVKLQKDEAAKLAKQKKDKQEKEEGE